MNERPREKQIEVIAALCEGAGSRTAARLTGVKRRADTRRRVVAVSRDLVSDDPDQCVLISHVERQNLSLRMGQHRFTRLTNGFNITLYNHIAGVARNVMRPRE